MTVSSKFAAQLLVSIVGRTSCNGDEKVSWRKVSFKSRKDWLVSVSMVNSFCVTFLLLVKLGNKIIPL